MLMLLLLMFLTRRTCANISAVVLPALIEYLLHGSIHARWLPQHSTRDEHSCAIRCDFDGARASPVGESLGCLRLSPCEHHPRSSVAPFELDPIVQQSKPVLLRL